jgi:coiled-coil domain-containing protein 15
VSGKIERSLSQTSVSTSNLPNFVIRSLVDEYESKKQQSDERMKRISSMRKIYSNIERDKIKKFNSVKDLSENKMNSNSSQSFSINVKKTMPVALNNRDFDLKKDEAKKIDEKSVKPQGKEKKVRKNKKESNTDSEKGIERYIRHLKSLLKEKSTQLKQELPPLCQCNLSQVTLWDNDWSSCANNCLFYKNPKGIKNKQSYFNYFGIEIYFLYILKNMRKFC